MSRARASVLELLGRPLALKRAHDFARYGVWALTLIAAGNAFNAGLVAFRLSTDVFSDSAAQMPLIRMACWFAIACVATICAYFAWRQRSRAAMLVGAALLGFDWAEWAFGFLGRPSFTIPGFVAQSGTTILLIMGMFGSVRYHWLKANLTPKPTRLSKYEPGHD